MQKINKKPEESLQAQLTLGDLRPAAVNFVVITVTMVVGAILIANLQANDAVTTGSFADNISNQGSAALDTLAENLDLIALMIALGIVLFIVLRFLGGQ